MARPGRSPLEAASWLSGDFTDDDKTNPIIPPGGSTAAADRAIRSAPRKTEPNALSP